jgi:hypothetical protein
VVTDVSHGEGTVATVRTARALAKEAIRRAAGDLSALARFVELNCPTCAD